MGFSDPWLGLVGEVETTGDEVDAGPGDEGDAGGETIVELLSPASESCCMKD